MERWGTRVGGSACWSVGVLECWSGGVVEWWSGGVVEWWSDGPSRHRARSRSLIVAAAYRRIGDCPRRRCKAACCLTDASFFSSEVALLFFGVAVLGIKP